MCVCLVARSCPTLCNPMGYSPSGFSVHGILQARILEWVVISFFRGSSQDPWPGIDPKTRDQTQVSCIAGRFFAIWATREAQSWLGNTCWIHVLSIHLDKKITANHEEQISQVNDFSAFLCMGKCKNLGSLKSFLRYAVCYLGAHLSNGQNGSPYFFHSEFSSGCTVGRWLQWVVI